VGNLGRLIMMEEEQQKRGDQGTRITNVAV